MPLNVLHEQQADTAHLDTCEKWLQLLKDTFIIH